MYHQFKIHQFYVLSTQCIYVFCMDLRTNSDYFPTQHQLTGFYNRDLTLYSPVVTIRTTSLTFIILRSAQTVFLCVCADLKTNSSYVHIQHEVTGFYNRDLRILLLTVNNRLLYPLEASLELSLSSCLQLLT